MANARRFPPPWAIDEKTTPALLSATRTGCSFIYFEDERGRRTAANLLTRLISSPAIIAGVKLNIAHESK